MKLYVVTHPESARGIYDDWASCEAAVSGVSGARYQAVTSRAAAEAILSGSGVYLSPGVYAFVDGNHGGGVGVVFVLKRPDGREVEKELSSSVGPVFADSKIPGLTSASEIIDALGRLRNVLAELAALYMALRHVAKSTRLTVVHDYEGIGAWMTDRWKARDALVARIIAACRELCTRKALSVDFLHQRGHKSTFAGRNDFARYNAKADELAAGGARSRAS